jgi:hypothetical protein
MFIKTPSSSASVDEVFGEVDLGKCKGPEIVMVSGFFVSRPYQSEPKNLNPGGTNVVLSNTERIFAYKDRATNDELISASMHINAKWFGVSREKKIMLMDVFANHHAQSVSFKR